MIGRDTREIHFHNIKCETSMKVHTETVKKPDFSQWSLLTNLIPIMKIIIMYYAYVSQAAKLCTKCQRTVAPKKSTTKPVLEYIF